MRIARVRAYRFRIPFSAPFQTSTGTATEREGVIVRLETAEGAIGLGEASFLPGQGDIDALFSAAAWYARRKLPQRSRPQAPPAAARRAVLAAFEIAEFDALARTQGQILASHLNQDYRTQVRVNAVVAAEDTVVAVERAREAAAQGYDTIKLKVGMAASVAEEAARVSAVRDAIGRAKLRLDANGAWHERQAAAMLDALSCFDIEYLEQPLPPGMLAAQCRLRRSSPIPIAADEGVVDAASARRIIAASAADLLVLKPLRLGGIKPAFEIARAALDEGIGVVVTTSVDTGVGTAAALHLAAALPESPYAHGLGASPLLASSLCRPSPQVSGGVMALLPGAGLGVDMAPDELERYVTGSWDIDVG